MKLSEILISYLERTGRTATDLAERSGINKATLSLYINGKQDNPNVNTLKKLATAMGISYKEMLSLLPDDTEVEWDAVPDDLLSSFIPVPVYDRISCGLGTWVNEDPEEHIAIPNSFTKKGCEYFSNQADGDSMDPYIRSGDYLIFERADHIEPGKIGSFSLNGKYYCKRLKKFADGNFWLISDNPEYDPIPIKPDDDFKVLGLYRYKLSKEQ